MAATDGAVLSSRILTVWLFSPPSLFAQHVADSPGVSAENVFVAHPGLVSRMTDSGSTTDQLSVTLPRNQPLAGKAGE